MQILEQIVERARQTNKTIVLSESDDPRVLSAAVRAQRESVANIVMVGDLARSQAVADEHRLDISSLNFIEPATSAHYEAYSQALFELRQHKGMSLAMAHQAMLNPLTYANMMLRMGDADGSVSGAVNITADVVRTAIQIVGPKPGSALISSFFLMIFGDSKPVSPAMIFSDCGLVIEPNEEELAQIALAASQSAQALLGEPARVAMLSFSTNGSANHPKQAKVKHATEQLRALAPDLLVDGEVQLDAAIVPAIAERKLPQSQVHGRANTLIFPDLNAGNIGYKLAERLGGATAIGPLMQGLNKPANDLSRGCKAEDVFYVIAVTCLQA